MPRAHPPSLPLGEGGPLAVDEVALPLWKENHVVVDEVIPFLQPIYAQDATLSPSSVSYADTFPQGKASEIGA